MRFDFLPPMLHLPCRSPYPGIVAILARRAAGCPVARSVSGADD